MLKKIWRANQRNPTIFMPCLYRSVFVFVGFCFLDLLQYLMSFILLLEDYISITGLGPYPLSLGMVYPRRPHRLWWVLTLNLNRTTATIQYTLCFNTFFSTHFLGWGSVLWFFFFFFWGGGGGYHNQLQILHISTCKSEVCMRFEHCAFTFNTFLCVPC